MGAEIVDTVSNKRISIHAKKIVNATGPWVDGVRALDAIENNKKLKLTKGVHVVIDQSVFPLNRLSILILLISEWFLLSHVMEKRM